MSLPADNVACRFCGCTPSRACLGGCSWAILDEAGRGRSVCTGIDCLGRLAAEQPLSERQHLLVLAKKGSAAEIWSFITEHEQYGDPEYCKFPVLSQDEHWDELLLNLELNEEWPAGLMPDQLVHDLALRTELLLLRPGGAADAAATRATAFAVLAFGSHRAGCAAEAAERGSPNSQMCGCGFLEAQSRARLQLAVAGGAPS